jgi:hypothetical protein
MELSIHDFDLSMSHIVRLSPDGPIAFPSYRIEVDAQFS